MEKKYTIGVLIGNANSLANSPHTMELMQGIYRAGRKLGVNLLFFLGIHSKNYYYSYFGENAEDDYDYQYSIVYDYARLGKVDALIISYGSLCIFLDDKDKAAFLKKFEGIPYLLVEEPDETHKGSSIRSDNYRGMYEIVEHLVKDHGYRNFTFLGGPEGNTDASERKQAVLDVLRKYQIPFGESRIRYGDYSSCVESQINQLLDAYPDMEAMICANDVMADTVYLECEKRGLTVGKDIAVTGYDDWEVSRSMNPPLTTVLQNAYDMGYMAVLGVLELCKGKNPRSVIVPAQVIYRASCGCRMGDAERKFVPETGDFFGGEEHGNAVADQFLEQILSANSDGESRETLRSELRKLFRIDFLRPENREEIVNCFREILDKDERKQVPPQVLAKTLDNYVSEWADRLVRDEQDCRNMISVLWDLRDAVQSMILSDTIKRENEEKAVFEQKTWFLPLIARDMMNHIDDEKEFYQGAMLRLSALKAKSSYLYIFEEPIPHKENEEWKMPVKMYLAASQEGSTVKAYRAEERPVLDMDTGIGSYHSGNERFSLCVFCVFSGEMQYGILVTEIHPSDLSLYYLISMEIGSALRFYEISLKQRKTQQVLESLVKEVNEKNQILNFISEYDVLTGCLNRRGLLEQAVEMNKTNTGREAVVIFADMDHLKEINDYFGHSEGDFAIRRCAEVILEAVGKKGIVGRLGGDEFVAMILCQEEDVDKKIISRVKELNEEFNRTSEKEYYVEISMGCKRFRCGEDIVMSEILEEADKALYSAKRNRRKTVRKNAGRGICEG